jgi:hypothetical protein
MKHVINSIFILALVSCTNIQKNDKKSNDKFLEGKWYYTAYIDSTVLNKRIHDYSWTVASLSYEVTFDNTNPDSCYFKGYHEETMMPLKKVGDNQYWAGDSIQHWTMTFENRKGTMIMEMNEYMDKSYSQKADPRTYYFEKRNEISEDIKTYFSRNIFKGIYKDSIREIEFKDNFQVTGIDSATTFDVVLDFWEMVPQMDLIYFVEKDGKNATRYNWTFTDDKLILKTVQDKYNDGDFDGGVADSTVCVLQKVK